MAFEYEGISDTDLIQYVFGALDRKQEIEQRVDAGDHALVIHLKAIHDFKNDNPDLSCEDLIIEYQAHWDENSKKHDQIMAEMESEDDPSYNEAYDMDAYPDENIVNYALGKLDAASSERITLLMKDNKHMLERVEIVKNFITFKKVDSYEAYVDTIEKDVHGIFGQNYGEVYLKRYGL